MEPAGGRELEAAGVIGTKFGAVTLLRHPGDADGARSCLGSIKRLDEPNLQISGWSCQGGALPARCAAIGCILNRLILLTAETNRYWRNYLPAPSSSAAAAQHQPHRPRQGTG
jgi:hypothetical protein